MAADTNNKTEPAPAQCPAQPEGTLLPADKTNISKTHAGSAKTGIKPASSPKGAHSAQTPMKKRAGKTAKCAAAVKLQKTDTPAELSPARSVIPVDLQAQSLPAESTSADSRHKKRPARNSTAFKAAAGASCENTPLADQNRHAAQVEFLAATLFRELAAMHNLDATWERRLRLAARFHDLGWKDGRKGHHKASMRIIEHEDLGISPSDRPFVALLARYHRKAWPSLKHKRFAALCSDDRTAVRTLAAILRVADALDYSHGNTVRELALRFRESKKGKRRAAITLMCAGDATAEIARALEKGDLFEDVFHMELRISCQDQ